MDPVTLLWDVVTTLGIGFERQGPTPDTEGNTPSIILSQPMPRRSMQQSCAPWLHPQNRGASCPTYHKRIMDLASISLIGATHCRTTYNNNDALCAYVSAHQVLLVMKAISLS